VGRDDEVRRRIVNFATSPSSYARPNPKGKSPQGWLLAARFPKNMKRRTLPNRGRHRDPAIPISGFANRP
jgi:hypothetical protein